MLTRIDKLSQVKDDVRFANWWNTCCWIRQWIQGSNWNYDTTSLCCDFIWFDCSMEYCILLSLTSVTFNPNCYDNWLEGRLCVTIMPTRSLNMKTQNTEYAAVKNVMSYTVDLPLLQWNGKHYGNIIEMLNRDDAAGDTAMNVVSAWTSCWGNTNTTRSKWQGQVT